MTKTLFFILIVLFPLCSFGQTASKITNEECNGKIFVKVEQLPSFKVSKEAFEDTIASYLKATDVFYTNNKFTFMFLLTKRPQILDVQMVSSQGDALTERELTPLLRHFPEALQKYSSFWVPAIQNGLKVCYSAKCNLEFKEGKLSIRVFQ